MNYSLFEYYENAYEKIKAFKKDRFVYDLLKHVIFANNTKISFEYDDSFTISLDNEDEYIGIEIAGNDIVLKCIKSVNGDPMSLLSSEVGLINGNLEYRGSFMNRAGIDYQTKATIITENGIKKLKTTVYNPSRKKKNSTTVIALGDSYVTNRLTNQFTLLKDKSSVAQNVISELIEAQNSLGLNNNIEIEHKLEAIDKLKEFNDNGFLCGRVFDIVLLANHDESEEDNLKLSYQLDGKTVGIDVNDNKKSIYCEDDGKKSIFACTDGKYVAQIITADGNSEVGEIAYQNNHKYLITHNHKDVTTKIEYSLDQKDDLFLMTVFNYVGRDAITNINSVLYGMTKDEPYMC